MNATHEKGPHKDMNENQQKTALNTDMKATLMSLILTCGIAGAYFLYTRHEQGYVEAQSEQARHANKLHEQQSKKEMRRLAEEAYQRVRHRTSLGIKEGAVCNGVPRIDFSALKRQPDPRRQMVQNIIVETDDHTPTPVIRQKDAHRQMLQTTIVETSDNTPTSIIRHVVSYHNERYIQCYERELQKDPNLRGSLAVQVIASGTGGRVLIAATSRTMGEPTLDECVEKQLKQLTFPASQDHNLIKFTIEFWFSPPKRSH